jgi:hypothetical protein
MILLENKCDLESNLSETEQDFISFANKNKFIGSFRTSSKQGININESMNFLITHIIEKLEAIYSNPNNANNEVREERKNNVVLDKKKQTPVKKNSNCC